MRRHHRCARQEWISLTGGNDGLGHAQGAEVALSNAMLADFCVGALKEAIAKHGPPEILNTAQGRQFTGSAWITTLTKAGTHLNGRSRSISGQYLLRTIVVQLDAGGNLSQRNPRRLPSQEGHQKLDDVLQLRPTAFRA